MNTKKIIHYLCIAAMIMAADCSKEKMTTGTEITNGNCIGTIFNSDGSVARGAVVRLIPENYNPLSPGDIRIDSTYTDQSGRYLFIVTESNYYNVFAEKSTKSCLQESLYVWTDGKTIADDTLQESGFISGMVRLKPQDTIRSVYILVLGINIYTTPSDTSGSFRTPLLAEGTYSIKIFTEQAGYAGFDTTATVVKGSETILPVVYLPSSDAPSVASLSVNYDSATMYATVSWPMPDTSKLVSYSLGRKSRNGNDTLVMVGKTSTTYIDDLLRYDGDTVYYQLSAIGKNFKDGYSIDSRSLPICDIIHSGKTIDLQNVIPFTSTYGASYISIDRNGSYYILISTYMDSTIPNELYHVISTIQKIDSNGIVLTSCTDTSGKYSGEELKEDNRGNWYGLCKFTSGSYLDSVQVVKFDENLNVLKRFVVDTRDSLMKPIRSGFAVYSDGSFLLDLLLAGVIMNDSGSHRIMMFDSSFTKKNDYQVTNFRTISNMTCFENTLVVEQPLWDAMNTGYSSLSYYDSDFNLISSYDNFDFLNKCQPPWTLVLWKYTYLYGGPHGLIFSVSRPTDPNVRFSSRVKYEKRDFLLITNLNRQVLCRKMGASVFRFDQVGNAYTVSAKSGEYFRINKYSMSQMYEKSAR